MPFPDCYDIDNFTVPDMVRLLHEEIMPEQLSFDRDTFHAALKLLGFNTESFILDLAKIPNGRNLDAGFAPSRSLLLDTMYTKAKRKQFSDEENVILGEMQGILTKIIRSAILKIRPYIDYDADELVEIKEKYMGYVPQVNVFDVPEEDFVPFYNFINEMFDLLINYRKPVTTYTIYPQRKIEYSDSKILIDNKPEEPQSLIYAAKWLHGSDKLEKLEELLKRHGYISSKPNEADLVKLFSGNSTQKILWNNSIEECLFMMYKIHNGRKSLNRIPIYRYSMLHFNFDNTDNEGSVRSAFVRMIAKIDAGFSMYKKDSLSEISSILAEINLK